MDVSDFNPETAVIGGMSLLTIHMVIMAQIRKFLPEWKILDKIFDLINYPVAFVLILLVNPPWPLYESSEWGEYIGYSIASATLASVAAGKVLAEDKKIIHSMEVTQALHTPTPETPPTLPSGEEPQRGAELRPIVLREQESR